MPWSRLLCPRSGRLPAPVAPLSDPFLPLTIHEVIIMDDLDQCAPSAEEHGGENAGQHQRGHHRGQGIVYWNRSSMPSRTSKHL